MILVAGGTGRLGTKVVTLLRQRGLLVRVLTRDRGRAAHLAGAGVEIVEGDVRDPAAVRRAVAGAQRWFQRYRDLPAPRMGVPPRSIVMATTTSSSLRVRYRWGTSCSFRSKTLHRITPPS